MDNRTLLTVMICLTIWYAWLAVFPPEVPPQDGDGLEVADVISAPGEAAHPTPAVAEVPEPASEGPIEDVPFAACGARAVVDTTDGAVRSMTLDSHLDRYNVQALYSWALTGFEGAWKPYGEPPSQVALLSPMARGWTASFGSMDARPPYNAVVSQADGELVTRGVVDGVEIERRLVERIEDGVCALVMEVTWRNTGSTPVSGPLWVGVHDRLPDAGGRYEVAMRPWIFVDDTMDYATDLSVLERPEIFTGAVGWFGLADTYFASLAVVGTPDSQGDGKVRYSRVGAQDGDFIHGLHYSVQEGLAAGESVSETFRIYLGPKDMSALEAFDSRLSSAIDLGFLAVFAVFLLQMLKVVHMVVGDWALAIIGLTFLIKAAFFPLTQQSYRSQQAMQLVQPEIKKIQEEYRDQPEELQRRTIALFKERGVNPISGCLPMMVQMPVWFALYSVLLSAVELYHTKFLYLEDLTQPDPYLALPTLVMVMMFLQQRMMPTGNMDPAQARMMKLMPLVFGLLFFMFPAGLALYVLVNMLLSIFQQWYIKRTFKSPETAPAAQGV